MSSPHVDGRFEISRWLGGGKFGVVYQAYDTLSRDDVAIKFVTAELTELTRECFTRELRFGRKITSPFVCRIHDGGFEEERIPYFVMEYVSGTNMKAELVRVKRLVPDKVREHAIELCTGLQAIHETRVDDRVGIVHCDLKPANIMLDDEGKARIMDLGIAVAVGGMRPEFMTLQYAAPEQWLPDARMTGKSDIYSLGLILYELLTGQQCLVFASAAPEKESREDILKAHDAARIRSLSSGDIDPAFEHIIQQCLQPDPAKRPTAAQLRLLLTNM